MKYERYQSKKESCETIQKLVGIHNTSYYNRIFDHTKQCDKCSPVEIIRAHQQREATEPKFFGCSSTTSVTYAFRYYRAYQEKYPEIRDICVWFITHSNSWNNKVKFAKYISNQEAVDAVIHQAEQARQKMRWPPPAYTNRFWKLWRSGSSRRVPAQPVFTDVEKTNFQIFKAGALLGAEFVKTNRNNLQVIFDSNDIIEVMNG